MNDSLIEENIVLENSSQKLRNMIKKVVVRAKRTGIWWTLSKVEQGILSLSSKLEIRFRSMKLLRSIIHIVKEVKEKISFTYQNYVRGLKMAYKVAKFVSENGYKQAKDWVKDKNFIIWWGIFLNPETYTK
ncbi:MAG: hypothetical protein H5T50_01000 [Nitrososphaeria archaeon]|nr:hypothetical protein [Nitrososphaeria archaeon]